MHRHRISVTRLIINAFIRPRESDLPSCPHFSRKNLLPEWFSINRVINHAGILKSCKSSKRNQILFRIMFINVFLQVFVGSTIQQINLMKNQFDVEKSERIFWKILSKDILFDWIEFWISIKILNCDYFLKFLRKIMRFVGCDDIKWENEARGSRIIEWILEWKLETKVVSIRKRKKKK